MIDRIVFALETLWPWLLAIVIVFALLAIGDGKQR